MTLTRGSVNTACHLIESCRNFYQLKVDLGDLKINHTEMHKPLFILFLGSLFCAAQIFAADTNKHIVVLVWDGMRPDFISKEHTPALWQLAQNGVMFANHHPVYPSSTEVNGTAIATGAYPQDSTIIGNREYRPEINPLQPVDTQEWDTIHQGDAVSHGHFLLRSTVAETLQAAGLTTIIAGTKPVAQLHDRRDRAADYRNGILLANGTVLPASLQSVIESALGKFPKAESGDSTLPNEARDAWTTRALTTVLWSNTVPNFSLLWLSDPDFSQHPTSPGSVKSLAALESVDRKLATVLAELDRRQLRDKTDVFVVSDHGFSTINRNVDIAAELRNAGFPAQRNFKENPKQGDILVNGLGGSVMIYVIGHDSTTVGKIAAFFQKQDYTGVIFTQKKLAGTFDFKNVNIASPEAPDLAVSLRWSSGTNQFGAPGLVIADSSIKTVRGGTHASLSHFDMHNTLVGAGPDLKKGFINTYPTGNTDLAPTILWLLGVKPQGTPDGRVLSEALTVKVPKVSKPAIKRIETGNKIDDTIWTQYLQISRVNNTVYFDEGNGTVQLNTGH